MTPMACGRCRISRTNGSTQDRPVQWQSAYWRALSKVPPDTWLVKITRPSISTGAPVRRLFAIAISTFSFNRPQLGSANVEQLSVSRDIRLISLPPVEGNEALTRATTNPGNMLIEIPPGVYTGQANEEPVSAIALRHIAGCRRAYRRGNHLPGDKSCLGKHR